MSRTFGKPHRGLRGAATGLIGLALALLAALTLAPQASAAFTTGKCAGTDITGRGASFARDAHGIFNEYFKTVFCLGTPGFETLDVSYEAQGSGAGRTSVKVRDGAPRFGMTDEPPTPLEIQQMNTGVGLDGDPAADPNPNDNGIIHLVPAAVGAVAPLVNFPDDCDVGALAPASRTDEQLSDGPDAHPLGLVRVRFTKEQFEGIWAKAPGYTTWLEVFPELAEAGAGCAKPIIRIVRFDESGTSFAFKDYLDTIDGGRGWLDSTLYGPGTGANGGTRRWPGATFGPRLDCPQVNGVHPNGPGADSSDPDDPGPDQLTTSCFNGNQGIVSKLVVTDGSVGYSDISTARTNNPSLAIEPRADDDAPYDNDYYWTQVPSGPGLGAFEEATADPNGFRTDGDLGSNCQNAQFSNVPASTLVDWTPVSGVNSADAAPVCTLTYGLLFDDNAPVWGATPAEEAKARTVKDYWQSSLTDGAQERLFTRDYSPLPADMLAIARTAVDGIDWNKGGGGGDTPPPGGGGGTPPPAPGGGGVTPPPAPVKPTNRFSVPRTAVSSKNGRATVSVRLPGAGRVVLVGSAKVGKRNIRVGRVVLTANRAGTFRLMLKPSRAAMQRLRKQRRLRVAIRLTYTPRGGDARSATRNVVLKLAKPKKKRGRR